MSSYNFGYPMNGLGNVSAPMIKNPFAGTIPTQGVNLLNLTQIEGYKPVQAFTDENNTRWELIKSYFDGSRDVPDPKALKILEYWDHPFLGLKEDQQLYVYVVEGIRPPRVETEQPCRLLYQWFSKLFVKDFNPSMISEREWLKANVYAAPVLDGRMSKLRAICRAEGMAAPAQEAGSDALLKVEGLPNG